MAEEVVEWLRAEVAKRMGPWVGTDGKGNPQQMAPLCTPLVIMPNPATRLLYLAELGEQHTPEAVGRRMAEGAAAREPPS